MSMMHGFCCNCWFVENSAMVSGCFSNILSYCWWKRNSKPQTTARNVMRFPLKPYPWDILTIINCYNCRISATSPHTAWLMNTFHSEAKMVLKGCHPIPPWNMRFIFSKHHGLRHDDFEGLGCSGSFGGLQWRSARLLSYPWARVKCNLYAECPNVTQGKLWPMYHKFKGACKNHKRWPICIICGLQVTC